MRRIEANKKAAEERLKQLENIKKVAEERLKQIKETKEKLNQFKAKKAKEAAAKKN